MTPQTALLPADLAAVLDAYRTAEFATIGKDGVPIAWPTIALAEPARGTVVLTTSIALPQKAHNIRRNPHVALLFSDPTGSGRTDLPQVLVQGVATVPDRLVTSARGLEQYWARTFERQPASTAYSRTRLGRWFFDWYYMRLPITVEVTSVRRRSPLPAAAPAPRPVATGTEAYRQTARRLPGYSSAVLATVDQEGSPHLLRVHSAAGSEPGTLTVDVPPDEPVHPGPASLLCHGHDEQLWSLRSFVATGELLRRDGAWAFVPARYVPGAAGRNPVAAVRGLLRMRRTAQRYLANRNLPRPSVPWDEYEALKR